jgi:hypothetical protein
MLEVAGEGLDVFPSLHAFELGRARSPNLFLSSSFFDLIHLIPKPFEI